MHGEQCKRSVVSQNKETLTEWPLSLLNADLTARVGGGGVVHGKKLAVDLKLYQPEQLDFCKEIH